MRLLFELGLDVWDRSGEILRTADEEAFHIYDAYALVNTVLCTSVKPGSTTSDASPTMRRNCQRHLLATLEILEPTVLIVQGTNLHGQPPLRGILQSPRDLAPNLLEATVGQSRTLVCCFSHPYQISHQHLAWSEPKSDYVSNVVAPTIREVLRHT